MKEERGKRKEESGEMKEERGKRREDWCGEDTLQKKEKKRSEDLF